jgi:hypothetical protein
MRGNFGLGVLGSGHVSLCPLPHANGTGENAVKVRGAFKHVGNKLRQHLSILRAKLNNGGDISTDSGKGGGVHGSIHVFDV